MKRLVRKNFYAIAFMCTAFTANSQEVIENFQTWTKANAVDKNPTYTCDPVSIDGISNVTPAGGHSLVAAPIPVIDLTKVYGDISVKYTITNGGVWPECWAKATYSVVNSSNKYIEGAAPTPGISKGYVELNKSATGSAATVVGGSFVAGPFKNIEKIYLSVSGTGSSRTYRVFTSVNNGLDWTEVGNGMQTGNPGVFQEITTKLSNALVKIESYENIIRIHDFNVYTTDPTTVGITDLFINGSASLRVSENNVMVNSKESGVLEIMTLNGQIVAGSEIAAGSENTLSIAKSGMYVAKLVTNSGMSTKKIIIQ